MVVVVVVVLVVGSMDYVSKEVWQRAIRAERGCQQGACNSDVNIVYNIYLYSL